MKIVRLTIELDEKTRQEFKSASAYEGETMKSKALKLITGYLKSIYGEETRQSNA